MKDIERCTPSHKMSQETAEKIYNLVQAGKLDDAKRVLQSDNSAPFELSNEKLGEVVRALFNLNELPCCISASDSDDDSEEDLIGGPGLF